MAETKAVIFSDGKFQGIGNNGQVVPYGKLYFYESVTGNQVETYTTSTMETLNTFPIILSASGKGDVFVGDGQYDVTLQDKNGTTVWTINNYIPAGGQIQLNPVESIPTREEFTGIVGSSINLDQTPSTTVVIHKNGLLLVEAEYTLDGKTIVFTTPLIITDVVIVEFSAIVTAGINTGIIYDVDNITDLLSVNITYGNVNIKGYTIPNDGGGGIFNYDASIDKTTANAGTIIDPSVSLANQGTGVGFGCWVRQYDGLLKAEWFGLSTLDLYVNATGNDLNNGFTISTPFSTIQKAIETCSEFTIDTREAYKIHIEDGVYNEALVIPNNLSQKDNYLRFIGSTQSMQQDPSTWTGVILDGTNFDTLNTTGVEVGSYNNVEFEFILFRDWYNTAIADVSQVQAAMNIREFANVYIYGCAGLGNGFTNVSILPCARAVITGGVYDGARYVINNTGGRLSMTASASTYSIIKNGLEYGLYSKHDASNVLDYTQFDSNGLAPGAISYGAAIFAYKSGCSVDTRACEFTNNNIIYNARGGFIASNPGLPDVIGTGNARVWLNKGYGQDDLINYRSIAGRDLTLSFGSGSTTGATAALAYDSNAVIPAGYLMNVDQYLEIEVWGKNNAGGTCQLLPSMYDNTGANRYQLASFLVPDSGNFKIKLIVQASTGGLVASVYYESVNAAIGGTYAGQLIVNPINFATADLEFQVWGTTTGANTLTILKSRCLLWG